VNTKGITPGTDDNNNRIKKGGTQREREKKGKKNKRKKGKVEIQYRRILSTA
jgi:hypothetical protein